MEGVGAIALDDLRLVGAGGTNNVMAGELSRLVRRALPQLRLPEPRKAGPGAVVYPFDARLARLAVFYHRTCARVLWDLIETPARRLESLFEDVVELVRASAARFVFPGATLSVYAHGVADFPAGERQIIGTVKNGIIEGAARAGLHVALDVEAPALVFSVRGDDAGRLRVSLDLAGRPMNQRGYRAQRGPAPLREDLAAVLLMLARYDARRDLLIDPMAGSGTIAIEAACMGRALPIWVAPRRPALERVPAFAGLEPLRDEPLFADCRPRVIANDHDALQSQATARAATAAGVRADLEIVTSDFRELSASELRTKTDLPSGLILSNPPYGQRVGGDDLLRLYRDLAAFCARFPGYRAAFLVANREFESAFGARPRIKKPLSNGPLRGYFYLYDL